MNKGKISVNYGDTLEVTDVGMENKGSGGELFVDHRRGEVSELYEKLQGITQIKEREKRIELFQKTIALMTLGVDVSCLYSLMILASATQDQVEKKMIYFYLTHYAERNSDLALLMINTLRKDSVDEDPVIRSLALRSLSSLRIPVIIEYIESILKSGLEDEVGYVRKTAVMGCLKLYHYSKRDFLGTGLLDKLYDMMETELDPNAIMNIIYVLNEINRDEGGVGFSKRFLFKLLNNINIFSEWDKYVILQQTIRYVLSLKDEGDGGEKSGNRKEEGEVEEDVYQILNLLDDLIRHSSPTVFLTCVQLFAILTKSSPKLFTQAIERIKGPIFTQISTSTPEISYAIYSTLISLFSFLLDYSEKGELAKERERFYSDSLLSHFEDEYGLLFVRNGDPSYIQNIKLDLLPFISSETNSVQIIEELYCYSFELSDSALLHKSVYIMFIIAIKYVQIRKDSLEDEYKTKAQAESRDERETILEDKFTTKFVGYIECFLESESEVVLSSALMGLELVVESFPWIVYDVIEEYLDINLVRNLTFKTDGICSFLWIITKYPDLVQDDILDILEYVFTYLIETYDYNLNNPNETQHISPKTFSIFLTSCCRLFFYSPEDVRPILGKYLSFVIERLDYPDVKDQALFYYRLLLYDCKIAKKIISDESKFSSSDGHPNSVNMLKNYYNIWKRDLFSNFNTCSAVSNRYKKCGYRMDFFGNYLNSSRDDSTSSGADAERELVFKKSALMQPQEFERHWNKLGDIEFKTEFSANLNPKFSNLEAEFLTSLEDSLSEVSIYCIASGKTEDNSIKLFLYGITDNNHPDVCCLSELTVKYSPESNGYNVVCCIRCFHISNNDRAEEVDSTLCSKGMLKLIKSVLNKHIF